MSGRWSYLLNIFEANDYRRSLRDTLLLKKEQFGKPFTFQSMAAACRIQKAYLSKVLGGQGHLSEDQLYLAAEFLRLNAGEREFLSLLHAHERCTVQARQRELTERIETIRRQHLQTETHITAKPAVGISNETAEYYLDPSMQLVHMFLTISRYANDPERIARELGMAKPQIADVLDRLVRLGIVSYKDGLYAVERGNQHLSPGSRVFEAYRTLMRLKTLEQVPRVAAKDTYNFTVVFSANDETRAAIQARILDVIRSTESLVLKAPQEDVFQMTIDLFKWSQGAR